MTSHRSARERGAISTLFAVLLVFFMLIIATLGEAGRKLNNLGRAEDVASEVARAAAATLDLDAIANGVARIDVAAPDSSAGRAREEADKVLVTLGDDNVSIEDFDVTGDTVTVRVRVSGTSFLPGFSLDGVGSHSAVAFDPFG